MSGIDELMEGMFGDALRKQFPDEDWDRLAAQDLGFTLSLANLQFSVWTYVRQEIGLTATREQMVMCSKRIIREILNGWFKKSVEEVASVVELQGALGGKTPKLDRLLQRTPDYIRTKYSAAAKKILKKIAPIAFDLDKNISGLEDFVEQVKKEVE